MYSLSVKDVMDGKNSLLLPSTTSVATAAKMMAEAGIGAVMIVENELLVGIFTERDALFRVLAPGRDPATTLVGEVMTVEPKTVEPNQSYGYALLMMFEHGFRHAPVVANNKILGIVSSRNAMDPDLEEFASESSRRQYIKAGAIQEKRAST